MENSRQRIFQKLRPSCVELSTIGLRFKGNQAAVKDVLHVLEKQHQILDELSSANELDKKLAEYAFFPLTPIFNESQRLSPRCLEIAVQSVTILVRRGWRQDLAPEMARQLLLLMTLITGNDPRKKLQAPTDELKGAAFKCIAVVVESLFSPAQVGSVLQNQTTKTIIDQLTYLLTESIAEDVTDFVQATASEALFALFQNIPDRVLLGSLLPRTVSSLTKALKPSTWARRTQNVLVANLNLLCLTLQKVLAGDVVADAKLAGGGQEEALNDFWLQATSSQVQTALQQVVRLRNSDYHQVRYALAELCACLIEDCSMSLSDSVPVLLETLVTLCDGNEDEEITLKLKRLMLVQPALYDTLRSKFFDWTQALPRLMQGNEERPKQLMLSRITTSFDLMGEMQSDTSNTLFLLTSTLLKCVSNISVITESRSARLQDGSAPREIAALDFDGQSTTPQFAPILFDHQSQQASLKQLQILINNLKQDAAFGSIGRHFIDNAARSDGDERLASVWLAVQLLAKSDGASFNFEDLILVDATDFSLRNTRSYLINDLYFLTKEHLISSTASADEESDWRLTALAMQVLVLQAQQLRKNYRDELYETLYPVLALFSSRNLAVQQHAITTLNLLASACEYPSAKVMLIENVDYVVNSIAWRLNTFNLSLEAPQVLNMAVRLVGASLVPYLDDLIASIFAALDSYHGYAAWVEVLFTVLKTVVDESVKQPQLAITDDRAWSPSHEKRLYITTTLDDILARVHARKRRKLKHKDLDFLTEAENPRAPHRPWTRTQDDPSYKPLAVADEGEISLESILQQDEEAPLPLPSSSSNGKGKDEDEDPTKPLSRSHDLLLKIAQATVPHLSSPSPRVRHLLLQLLCQISPLLSRHENTFLPLINAIWPAVTSRLFAKHSSSSTLSDSSSIQINQHDHQDFGNVDDDPTNDTTREMPYTVAEAARLVSILSKNAGDFMTSRIEQIFPSLVKLFNDTRHAVEQKNKRRGAAAAAAVSSAAALNLTSSQSLSTTSDRDKPQDYSLPLSSSGPSALLTNLITLLTTLLTHVSLNLSTSDEIFALLAPFITDLDMDMTTNTSTNTNVPDKSTPLRQEIHRALEQYNADALWVLTERARVEREIAMGVRRGVWDRVWREDGYGDGDSDGLGIGLGLRQVVF